MQNANIPPYIKERDFSQKDKECSETTYKAVLPVDHPGSCHGHQVEVEEELPLIVLFTSECGGMRSKVALLIRNSRRIHPPSDTGRMCLLHFSIWRGGEGETLDNHRRRELNAPFTRNSPFISSGGFFLSFPIGEKSSWPRLPISINLKNSAEKRPSSTLSLRSLHDRGGKEIRKIPPPIAFPFPDTATDAAENPTDCWLCSTVGGAGKSMVGI